MTGGVEVGGGRRLKEERANHVSHTMLKQEVNRLMLWWLLVGEFAVSVVQPRAANTNNGNVKCQRK